MVSGGRLEEVKNNGNFYNSDPKKWSCSLMSDGNFSRARRGGGGGGGYSGGSQVKGMVK